MSFSDLYGSSGATPSPVAGSGSGGFSDLFAPAADQASMQKVNAAKATIASNNAAAENATSPASIASGTLSDLWSFAKQTGSDMLSAFTNPFKTAPAQDLFTNPSAAPRDAFQSLATGLSQAATQVENGVGQAFNDHQSALQRGVGVAEAGLGAVNAAFAPVNSVITYAQHVPGLGYLASGLNGLFGAIGQGGGDIASRAVDALPISQQAKDEIKPVAQQAGALAAQILVGKAGGDTFSALSSKTKDIINTVNGAIATTNVRNVPVENLSPNETAFEIPSSQRTVPVAGESTNVKVPVTKYGPNGEPLNTIQMGSKARPTMPTIEEGAPLSPAPKTLAELAPADRAKVISDARSIDAKKATSDYSASLQTALARFNGRAAEPAAESTFEPVSPATGQPKPVRASVNNGEITTPVENGLPKPSQTSGEITPNEEMSVASGKPGAVRLRTTEGTGETQTRGLAAGIEAKAIEQGLTTGFGDLPEYKSVSMADQAAKAADLINNDYATARAVALGEKAAPHGLLPESVLVGIEKKALAEGDVNTLRELATNSRLTYQATTMGQRIRALAERDPSSPVGAIQSIADARRAAVEAKGVDIPKEIEKTVAEAKTEVRKAVSSRPTWEQFIEQITCK